MNLKHLLQGQSGYGLLPEGLEDAGRAAKKLAGKGIRLIYCSDQLRAKQTARILHRHFKLKTPLKLSLLLREMDYGRVTGHFEPSVRKRFPRFRTDATFVFPGGESFEHVQARALRWLEKTIQRHPTGAIAVVTHGGWLRTLFAGLMGKTLSDCLYGTIPHGWVGTLQVTSGKRRLKMHPGVSIFSGRKTINK